MRDKTRKQASQVRRTDEPQTVQPILADSSLTKPVQVSLILVFLGFLSAFDPK